MDISKVNTLDEFKDMVLKNIRKYNHKDIHGYDIFLLAVKHGKFEIFKYMLKVMEWPIDTKNNKRYNAYNVAILYGHLDFIKYIEFNIPGLINHMPYSKETPLHLAALSGNLDILNYILKTKYNDQNVLKYERTKKTSNNDTVYFSAIKSGNLEMVKEIEKLMTNKNDTNWYARMLSHKNNKKEGPFLVAVSSGSLEMVKYFEKVYFDYNQNLSKNIYSGKINAFKFRFLDKYEKDVIYMDAFLSAVKNGHIDILKYLREKNWKIEEICKGKLVYKRCSNDNNAYLVAAANGQLEVIKFLEKEYNWDPFTKTNYEYHGFNAYDLSVSYRHTHITNYLKNTHNLQPTIKSHYNYNEATNYQGCS